ncbi:Spy0128 family protein [Collinsella intestinalis]|uniref:Spy0128 family protein n=1 Tax=Collinsella intestinalis TaxID=147207 RepID=UPI0022E4FE32|nr:FctA domain-containing protein [Collinsella intestinalis]
MAPALAGMALAATVMTQTAVANPLDDLASLLGLGDAAPVVAADHVVSDTVSPSGTTIDLFDYWLTTEDGPENPGNITSAGINAGNQLWFSDGIPEGGNGDYGKTINHYVGGGKGPYFGIVAPELGHDGYPVLAEGKTYSLADGGRQTEPRSLAYLFNPLVSSAYKRSYANATGLLQLDADGYYYYHSTQNFASYNKDANRFVLYDGAAVDGSGFADSTKGMFFPFNTAEQVFTRESLNGSGPLQSTVGPGGLNHYFGLSMTSYFMQPANGQSNGKDMVFEFSGDDDVWVFIDGKLVGDVGGIHERVGLSINFATGAIRIYNTSTAGGDGNKGKTYKETSLQQVFGGEKLENGTFKAGSYHTLKFYYLERGSGPSNLSLKYNLVDIPASTVTKVDQLGRGVQGAEFELYQTDAAYENERPIGSGVTDATGSFTFTDANTVPINFMNLNASGISHYVLKETKTPEGYRKSPDARLKYVTNADKSIGFLLSDNYWESGVYARPEQVVTIVGDTVKEYGSDNKIEVGDGNVFAVILKRDRSEKDMDKCWHAVSGNSVDGWTVSKDAITSTTQLADVQKAYFKKNEDGKYVADLKELPGDPEQYYSMVSKENQGAGNFDYTVAFYAYDGKGNIKRLDTSAQYFQRQSAANLHVTDIRNMLHVQKVDDAGTPVNGVTFNLYRSDQMSEADGKLAPRAGEDPAFAGRTQDNRNNNDATIKMDGMLSLGPLNPGTYYLVEDANKTPKGYIPNDAVVRVIVDDEGVHAGAGVEGDGVVTLGGIGSLVDSMSQFGVKDDIDMTLYRVVATKATATASDADGDGAYALGGWTLGSDTVAMENRPDSAYLEYVPVDSGIKAPGFTVDTGYVRAMVSQAEKPDTSDLGMASWTDLSRVANKNLSALFTGTNIVRITNERTASIAVSKKVAVPEGFELSEDAKERDFTLTFTFGNLGNLSTDTAFDAATFSVDENGAEHQVGNDYAIKSGETHTLKHGETIKVYGLPDGAAFTVTETPDTLYPQTQPAEGGAIEGTVAAGKTQADAFVNTYTPAPVTVEGEAFSYEKHFNLMKAVKQADGTYKEKLEEEDGAWDKFQKDEATFTMLLAEVKEGADVTECPFPDGAITSEKDGNTFMTKSVTRASDAGGASGNFGSITFDRPGTYTYLITEDLSGTLVDGITYSRASYRVVVTVTDNEKGKLEASIVKKQTFGEAGVELDTPLSIDAATPVTFNNSAAYDSITLGPNAYKQLVDTAGDRALAAGEFTFGAVPITEGAPIPTDQNGNPLPTDTDVNGTQYYKSTNDTLGYIAFGTATFTQEHVKTGDSATYVYKLFEVIPNDAVNANVDGGQRSYKDATNDERARAGWTKEGVTYDGSVYFARVIVKIDGNSADNVNHVTAAISYHESPEPDAAAIIGNSVTFKNVYDPDDAVLTGDTRIKGQKTLTGRNALEGEAFTFELTARDDFTKQALGDDALIFGSDKTATKLVAQARRAENGKPCDFVFDSAMTFTKVGTYRFSIKEMVPGDPAANMTYDPTTAEAVVTVTDAGGKLKAEVNYINPQDLSIADRAVFTNVYHAEGALAEGIEVSKVMTGRAMKAGEFSATVVGIDNTAGNTTAADANAKLPAADAHVAFPKAAAGKTVSKKILGDILFTQEDAGKTFSYIVAEDVPAEGVDTEGVSYDRSQYRVDLAVTDTGTGKLSVTPTVTKIVDRDGKPLTAPETVQAALFENRYEPAQTVIEDTTGVLPLTKKLSGRGWLDTDKFEFALTAKSLNGKTDADSLANIPMPADAHAVVTKDSAPHYDSTTGAVPDATIKDFGFKGIAYKQTGTYVYEVREVIPDDATNPDVPGKTYGRAGADERAKAGWTRGGVTYDSAMVATVTCEVKDNLTGQLYVEASCDPAAVPTFTNEYTPGAVEMDPAAAGFTFTKVLEGKAWDGDAFAFTLEGADGAPMPEADPDVGVTDNGDGTLTKTVSAATREVDGSDAADFGFGPIRFERAGVYAYTVREVVPEGDAANPGITYDRHTAKVTVTVTDGGSGILTAIAEVESGTFTNRYATGTVDFDAAAGLKIVKNMTGRAIAKDAFSFTVEGMDNESAAKLNGGHELTVGTAGAPLVGNTATETLSVATKLSFAQEDVSKTYRYTVSEAGGGKIIDGVTYDGAKHKLAFAVADGGSGVLEVAVSLDGEKVATYTGAATSARVADPVTVTFNNSYDAGSVDVGGDGAAAIKAHKTLTGRPLEAGEFSFNVVNKLDKNAKLVTSGTNDAQGDIAFEPISYTMEKLNNDVADGLAVRAPDGVYTYAYAVSEDTSSLPAGVTPVVASFPVEVLVTDSGTGSLGAQVVYPEGSDGSLEFRNAYGTGVGGATELAVGGAKVLKVESGETAPDIAGKFTFTLTGSKDAPMPEGAKDGVKTATNDASGSVDLGTISYTMESVFGSGSGERTKTFDYTVTESGEVPGVVNDLVSSRSFTVTVTDNGDGTLSAVSSEKPGAQFTFTNTYSVKPFDSTLTGKGGFAITKTLDGRDLREGEFEFALVSQGEGEPTVVTAKNDASGKVAFPAISFNAPGEYHYRLAEVDGGLSGVTYDTTVYDVTAKVVDNGDGTLGVTWSVSKDGKALEGKEIVFANSYKAAGTSITFNAAKVLTGRDLKKGEFTFELRDANGKVLQTVKNGALTEGGYAPIAFDPITYDEPGTYDYRIVEVKGDAEGITYDKTVFTYHVVVTDDGNGQLQVEWTVGETGAPVFQNVFVKPEDPKPADPANPANPGNGGSSDKLVQTGDNALVGMFTAAFAGIAAIGAGFTARRKKK